MNSLTAALIGAVFAVGLAVGSFLFGRSHCPGCAEADRVQVLRGVTTPVQKLVLLERGDVQEFNWTMTSTWPGLVNWVAKKLQIKTKEKGYLRFDVKYSIGYDLKNTNAWSITDTGGKLIVNPPPLEILGCPAVLTHTMRFEVTTDSYLVSSEDRLPSIVAATTAQALAGARKHANEHQEKYQAMADAELRSFLVAMASPLGIKDQDIVIEPDPKSRKPAKIEPTWELKLGKDGELDMATRRILSEAGCLKAA